MLIPITGKGRNSVWSPSDNGRVDVFRLSRYDMRANPASNVNVRVSLDDWFSRYAPGQTSIKAVCRISGITYTGMRDVYPTITPILPIQVFQAFGIESPASGIMLFSNRVQQVLESRKYPISPDSFSELVDQKTSGGPMDYMTILADFVEFLLKGGMPVDDIIAASNTPAVGPDDRCAFGPKTVLDVLDPNSFSGRTYYVDIRWSNGEVQLATAKDAVELYNAGSFDPGITMSTLSDGRVMFNTTQRRA